MWTNSQTEEASIGSRAQPKTQQALPRFRRAFKGIGSVYKRHPVTKFEHSVHGASKRRIMESQQITVYMGIHMYVRRSSFCSCYSQPLLSYVPPVPLPTRVNDAYTWLQLRVNSRMGGGASKWHSFQSMRGRTRGVRRSFQLMRGCTRGVRQLHGQSRPIISK